MIDGITVLNENTVEELNLWVFLLVVLIVMVVGIVLSIRMEQEWIFLLVGFVGTLFIALPIGLSVGEKRVQYECLIDDSVSMVEVHERYEIIEKRGDIWVLKEKE